MGLTIETRKFTTVISGKTSLVVVCEMHNAVEGGDIFTDSHMYGKHEGEHEWFTLVDRSTSFALGFEPVGPDHDLHRCRDVSATDAGSLLNHLIDGIDLA